MFQNFVDHAVPIVTVRYKELLAAPAQQARMLSEFAGLSATDAAIEQAAAFVGSGTGPR